MNPTVRYGIAAVAVLVVALVGINFLSPGNVGSPGSSALPTSDASPTPDPTVPPTATCVDLNPDEPSLAVDRYCVGVGDPSPVDITFDIPAIGWWPYVPANDQAALINGEAWGLAFLEIDNVYADPCDPDAGVLDPPIGPTADDLVASLRGQARFEVSSEGDVTIGGYSGRRMEISAADDCLDIDSSWGITPSGHATDGSLVPTPERSVWLWVGDVDGTRLVVSHSLSALPSLDEWASGVRDPNRHAADLLELEAIVESLRFNQ